MEKGNLPEKVEPPGVVVHSDEKAIKQNKIKKAVKEAFQQTPEMLNEAVDFGKEYLKSKGIQNKNTQADTMTKHSKFELDRAEYYKIKAETKKIEQETESIAIQNKKNTLEHESVNKLHEELLTQNIPHYINEGKIIFITDGDKK